MKLYINANRAGYAPDQIRNTMTVGELIAALGRSTKTRRSTSGTTADTPTAALPGTTLRRAPKSNKASGPRTAPFPNQQGGTPMPGITYTIRFIHRDPRGGIPCEEQEHLSLAEAWNAFRLFDEPNSADLYSEIELIERNWEEGSERLLARLTLGERYGF